MTDSNCRRWLELSDREATGEPLTELEQQWREQHVANCAECALNSRLWSELGQVATNPELTEATVAPAAARGRSLSPIRKWQRLLQLGGWVAAAAASVALAAGWFSWKRHQLNGSSVVVAGVPTIQFVSVSGDAHLGSKPIRVGDVFVAGERLCTEHGRVCFALDSSMLGCLDAGSEAQLGQLEPTLVRIKLDRGRLMSRLELQPAGRQYVVVTSKASVVAKGTQFVVGVDADQRVSVQLHEGHLGVDTSTHQQRDLRAPAALLIADTIAEVVWSDAVSQGDREMLRLAQLSRGGQATELDVMSRPVGASVMVDDMALGPTPASAAIRGGHRLVVAMPGYASVTEVLPTDPGERLLRNYELSELVLSGATPAVDAARETHEPAEFAAAIVPSKSKTATAVASPRGLLAHAQALRAEGRLRECANVYRQLTTAFAASDEARVALVSLGELELSVLRQPAQALRSFETYLQQAGPLTREARFGRIRALHLLSRKAEENTAVARFLHDYPNSAQSEGLRRRAKAR